MGFEEFEKETNQMEKADDFDFIFCLEARCKEYDLDGHRRDEEEVVARKAKEGDVMRKIENGKK